MKKMKIGKTSFFDVLKNSNRTFCVERSFSCAILSIKKKHKPFCCFFNFSQIWVVILLKVGEAKKFSEVRFGCGYANRLFAIFEF